MSHTSQFAVYGTKPRNARWSWSARSDDGKTVVVRLWQDAFKNGTATYRSEGPSPGDTWQHSPGYRELIDNLAWARDECAGAVRVIIAIAEDRYADPRSIRESFAKPDLIMRVTELNEATGAFELARV